MLLLFLWSPLEQKKLSWPPAMAETCALPASSSRPWPNLTKTWKVSPTPCSLTSCRVQGTLKATFSEHALYDESRRKQFSVRGGLSHCGGQSSGDVADRAERSEAATLSPRALPRGPRFLEGWLRGSRDPAGRLQEAGCPCLVVLLANCGKMKVELKPLGSRAEAGALGGLGVGFCF